jgi:hypothetical protein
MKSLLVFPLWICLASAVPVIQNACHFPVGLYDNIYFSLNISPIDWENGAKCGRCFKIKNKEGFGVITNICPDCVKGQMSFANDRFSEVYELPCPHLSKQKPKYRTQCVDEVLRIQFVDTPRPITHIMLSENPEIEFEKTWDNFWMVQHSQITAFDSMWQFPVDVTCVLANGEMRRATIELTNEYKELW